MENSTGWKTHLSVNAADVRRATDIIMDVYKQYGGVAFKVTNPETTEVFANPAISGGQAGKMFTLYDVGERNWPQILREVERGFKEAHIRSGPPVVEDAPVPGSDYAFRRNDRGPNNKYIAASDAKRINPTNPANPYGQADPLDGLDVRSPSAQYNARAYENSIARQRWQGMNSPNAQGILRPVMRADVDSMGGEQRAELLRALKSRGIRADVVHSNTFNRDYVQVEETYFGELGDAVAQGRALASGKNSAMTPSGLAAEEWRFGALGKFAGKFSRMAGQFMSVVGIGTMMVTIGTTLAHAATPGDEHTAEQDVRGLANMAVNPAGAVAAFATAAIAEPIQQLARLAGIKTGPTLSETFASLSQKIGAERAVLGVATAPLATAAGNLLNNLSPVIGSAEFRGTQGLLQAVNTFQTEYNSVSSGNMAALAERSANFADKLAEQLRDKGPAGDAVRKAMGSYLNKLGASSDQYAEFLTDYADTLRAGGSTPRSGLIATTEQVASSPDRPAAALEPKPRVDSRPPLKGAIPDVRTTPPTSTPAQVKSTVTASTPVV
jgi:hypothetical protein